MRILITLFVLSVSFSAQAQTVEKINGNEAVVHIHGSESLSVGDQVSFLDEKLNVSGQGEVTKISGGGKKAIVRILSGNTKNGMSLEKDSMNQKSNKTSDEDNRPTARPAAPPQLDEEDLRILRIGEISTTAYVLGGIVGTYPIGLGVGHAIQGRYMDKGWIFTVGELASIAVLFSGVGDCWNSAISSYDSCNSGAIYLGAMGFVGFRIWEIVDVWAAPPEINRRYHELKSRMEPRASLSPIILPTKDGALLGLKMTF